MMDSFVEAQNNLKRMCYAGFVTLFRTRQSHAVRFSFMPIIMRSPGLKPIEAENARSASLGFYVPGAVVGAETRPRAFGETPLSGQQIDPHGNSVHMGDKNRMKPAVSDEPRRGPSISGGVIRAHGSFGSSYDGTVHP